MCKVVDNDAGKVAGGEEAFNAEIRGAPPISKVKRFNLKKREWQGYVGRDSSPESNREAKH